MGRPAESVVGFKRVTLVRAENAGGLRLRCRIGENARVAEGIGLLQSRGDIGPHAFIGVQPDRRGLRFPSRLRQFDRHRSATPDLGFRPQQLLHRDVGRDMRPAAAIAEIHAQREGEPEAVGLGDGPLHGLVPLLAASLDRAARCPARPADLHPDHAADADALHRFEILGDALAADVAVDPEPEHPGPRLGGRSFEGGFQIGRILPGQGEAAG